MRILPLPSDELDKLIRATGLDDRLLDARELARAVEITHGIGDLTKYRAGPARPTKGEA